MFFSATELELILDALNVKMDRLLKKSRRFANEGDSIKSLEWAERYADHLEVYTKIVVLRTLI